MLALLGPVFVTIFMLLRIIFNTIIYDLDDPCQSLGVSTFVKLKCGYLTSPCMPIIQIFFELFGRGILQIVISLLLAFVFHPLLAAFFFVYAIVRYLITIVSDFCMYCCITCEGREPQSDSCCVYRVSGQGFSYGQFFRINPNDVKILIVAQLEMIMLR